LRRAFQLAEETYWVWRETRVIRLGAGIAYYGVVAAVPTVTIIAALTARFISLADLEQVLTHLLAPAFGAQAERIANALLMPMRGFDPSSLGLVGLGGLLFAATVLIVALQDAFDTIWQAPVQVGIWRSILRRAAALGVVVAAAIALLVSFAIQAAVDAVATWLPGVEQFERFLGDVASFAALVVGIVLLFRFLPTVGVPWRAAIVAGIVTSPFVVVGTWAIGVYLQHVATRSASGVAGAVMLVLVWFYYEAQIVLAGVTFTRVLALRLWPSNGPAGSGGDSALAGA